MSKYLANKLSIISIAYTEMLFMSILVLSLLFTSDSSNFGFIINFFGSFIYTSFALDRFSSELLLVVSFSTVISNILSIACIN